MTNRVTILCNWKFTQNLPSPNLKIVLRFLYLGPSPAIIDYISNGIYWFDESMMYWFQNWVFRLIMVKVGHGWWNQFKFFVGKGLCPYIITSHIVFQKNLNRKIKTNFPKSDQNHYYCSLKEWKFGRRGGKIRAICRCWLFCPAILILVHALVAIADLYNVFWRCRSFRMVSFRIRS